MNPPQPSQQSAAPAQSYPAVAPYPPVSGGGGVGPAMSNGPSASSTPPVGGPGSGFPARSGLAGMTPGGPGAPSGAPAYAVPQMGGSMGGGGGPGGIAPGTGAGRRGGLPEEKNVAQLVTEHSNKYARQFQMLLDRSTPHVLERWLVTLGIFLLFALNVILRQGWYIVCYALAIYILNLFLAFLQPRLDPSLAADLAADDVEEGAPGLPGSSTPKSGGGIKGLMSGFRGPNGEEEEFRPFIRRLPEFKFWYSATKATCIAITCTITRATDVPVYWPILLIYFFTLFGITMRRQIQHMIKYKYVPFDLGKSKYNSKK